MCIRDRGTTTYGKGVMQVTHSLKDGSAIRITVAQYNPPKSPNYDGVGLTPDYEVTLTEEQQEAFDTLDETTDPQLKKALEVVNATATTEGTTEGTSESTSSETTTEETSESTSETTSESTSETASEETASTTE